MSKEKQNIKSSDWLVGVYSKEELANIKEQAIKEAEAELQDKQIEEMVSWLWHYPIAFCLNCYNDCEKAAKLLYNVGYRKQNKGVWITDRFGLERSICSVCGAVFEGDGGNFCSNCGAKMKGGD